MMSSLEVMMSSVTIRTYGVHPSLPALPPPLPSIKVILSDQATSLSAESSIVLFVSATAAATGAAAAATATVVPVAAAAAATRHL